MQWFDAGVNLLDARFDVDEVIRRALDAGVERICAITTTPQEWQRAQALYTRYPQQLCYTVGVHPHYAKDVTTDDLQQLEVMAQQPGVVAIGECGLDFNRNFSPPDTQLVVFEAQLKIASKLNKTVYLHERDAFTAQLALLKQYPPVAGIAHCFTGTEQQMHDYLAVGLYIGITGWLCDDKRGESLQQAVCSLPLERLILETDAPYLFPKNQRPRLKNNEPAMLPAIGRRLSELLGVPEQRISETSFANTMQLFRVK
ncbi:TatD family hydrolase [Salinimonas sediminis]|uniref:TatD family deoxyribonuclease n=1 Tax=Salinimonas sediminis TaxID=2303538 RepID=A0A346NI90_9ALTE|nr:TatD family hydrolase [Salinimonas sediminis]AXR05247.1 TatD family deoxyribonuclease [Salinimonas sediminis]